MGSENSVPDRRDKSSRTRWCKPPPDEMSRTIGKTTATFHQTSIDEIGESSSQHVVENFRERTIYFTESAEEKERLIKRKEWRYYVTERNNTWCIISQILGEWLEPEFCELISYVIYLIYNTPISIDLSNSSLKFGYTSSLEMKKLVDRIDVSSVESISLACNEVSKWLLKRAIDEKSPIHTLSIKDMYLLGKEFENIYGNIRTIRDIILRHRGDLDTLIKYFSANVENISIMLDDIGSPIELDFTPFAELKTLSYSCTSFIRYMKVGDKLEKLCLNEAGNPSFKHLFTLIEGGENLEHVYANRLVYPTHENSPRRWKFSLQAKYKDLAKFSKIFQTVGRVPGLVKLDVRGNNLEELVKIREWMIYELDDEISPHITVICSGKREYRYVGKNMHSEFETCIPIELLSPSREDKLTAYNFVYSLDCHDRDSDKYDEWKLV